MDDLAHRSDGDGERFGGAPATAGSGDTLRRPDPPADRMRFARQLADAVGESAVRAAVGPEHATGRVPDAAPVTELLPVDEVRSAPARRAVAAGPGPVAHRWAPAPHGAAPGPAQEVLGEQVPPAEETDPDGAPVVPALPALREAVFGAGRAEPAGPREGGDGGGPEIVPLPAAPALVCDGADRIVRVNPALLELAGRPAGAAGELHAGGGPGLIGMRLGQLVVGPDSDARLVRPDGELLRVRLVRWDLPGRELRAVVVVEMGRGSEADRSAELARIDRRWVTELERLAGVGTWSYEFDGAQLRRSATLVELYRSTGVDPDAGGGPLESEQVALLCRGLRSGAGAPTDHHVELRLPGDRLLSCRAEVETAPDGRPLRVVGVVRDLTAQRRAEHAGRRFSDLAALVPSGVLMIDRNGVVADANPAMCTLLDVPLSRLRGTPAAAMAADGPAGPPAVGGPRLPRWLRPVPPGARHAYRVDAAPLLRGDGTTVWCEVSASVSTADDGSWFWLVVCTDIGERRRAAELLRSAGTVDELTRLPNRAACLALVDGLLAGAGGDRVAVVCGDLDDFARVNSSLGHEAGDDLLVTLAGRLQRELPVGCTAARLSGDEFVVICADHAEVGGPDQLARTVADLLRATVTVHGSPVPMTATVGLATPVPTGDVRAADLLRFAEVAMQDAKRRQSRGGIGMATDGVVSTATRALELEAELRAAVAGTGLVLEYQPVVLPDGTIASAEALVRWHHPVRGVIPPGDFLPVAQRCGLLRDLDLWVLRTACTEAATWPEHRGVRPSVAVNLAGLLPGDADFLAAVDGIVAESGLPRDRLVLELVETSLVALPPHALAAMAELVDSGVRFAVDDFGTGYSSLARLKELPAQTVKVDRAFVTGVGDDPAAFAVARAVVDMARAMGRSTVAEGVETAQQFHVLRGIGVDAYQGWLFARPVPPAALRELLVGDRLPTPATSAILED